MDASAAKPESSTIPSTSSAPETPYPTSTTSTTPVAQTPTNMLRPPVNRGLKVLDRSLFRTSFPLASATIFDPKNTARIKNELMKSKDIVHEPGVMAVKPLQDIRDQELDIKRKCVLLRQGIKHDDESTWSPTIQQLVEAKDVDIRPYLLELGYEHWGYHDIMKSILPEDMGIEIPTGYSQVGHVAHFNLRDDHLPYRHVIGEVVKDKQGNAQTVINKIDDVGSQSEFRTFAYEVLAGDGNMNVVHKEQGIEFAFDFSKVYWNTRLSTEHERMVGIFKPGETVCDVMAGVGPFAMPAAKKHVFVRANDLNPHGFQMMEQGAIRNKCEHFIKCFNMDGRKFIRHATKRLYKDSPVTVNIQGGNVLKPADPNSLTQKIKAQNKTKPDELKKPNPITAPIKTYTSAQTFDHYVMNLPATATEFLDAFIGVYAGQESLFEPVTNRKMPFIHVYCFSTNSDDGVHEVKDICERISERLQYTIRPEDCVRGPFDEPKESRGDRKVKAKSDPKAKAEAETEAKDVKPASNFTGDPELQLQIHNVRLVAPSKRMFCVTFRLPRDVAFKKEN